MQPYSPPRIPPGRYTTHLHKLLVSIATVYFSHHTPFVLRDLFQPFLIYAVGVIPFQSATKALLTTSSNGYSGHLGHRDAICWYFYARRRPHDRAIGACLER